MLKPNTIKNVGVGLRSCHYQYVIKEKPNVGWLELLTDNYLSTKGIPFKKIDLIRQSYPMTLHSVALSLGSSDPINESYIKTLLTLINRFEPAWISDHLCWSSIGGEYLHELLPLPYTEEALNHIVNRINIIQEKLPCPLLVENVSSYLSFPQSEMPEWTFFNLIAKKTGCKLLLDVNNIYVSATNHGFDPNHFIDNIDPGHVGEIHLAGFEKVNSLLIDTHGNLVSKPVWALYQKAIKRFGKIPTLIEWDTDIPDFPVLLEQASLATEIMNA